MPINSPEDNTCHLLGFNRLGLDQDELSHRSLVDELNAPGDFGEESVVFAATYVESRLDPRSTLADDNCPTRDQLAAESFKAKPLGV
jgi:hypothetical protein